MLLIKKWEQGIADKLDFLAIAFSYYSNTRVIMIVLTTISNIDICSTSTRSFTNSTAGIKVERVLALVRAKVK